MNAALSFAGQLRQNPQYFQFIGVLVILAFGFLSWVLRKLGEEAQRKRARDALERQEREMLRTGRLPDTPRTPVQPPPSEFQRHLEDLRRRRAELAARRSGVATPPGTPSPSPTRPAPGSKAQPEVSGRGRPPKAGPRPAPRPIVSIPGSSGPIVVMPAPTARHPRPPRPARGTPSPPRPAPQTPPVPVPAAPPSPPRTPHPQAAPEPAGTRPLLDVAPPMEVLTDRPPVRAGSLPANWLLTGTDLRRAWILHEIFQAPVGLRRHEERAPGLL